MKVMKKCAAAMLAALMAIVGVTGCGASFDASAYLKAILDNSYKNDSTAFVEQKLGTKEEAAELYQQGIDANIEQLSDFTLDEETLSELESVFCEVYAKADYTVGEAEKQDDNSYIVKVTYRPMTLFTEVMSSYETALEDKAAEFTQRVENGEEISEEEIEQIAIQLYIEAIKTELADIQYGEESTMVIRIELNDNVYTPNENDVMNLEYALLGMNE